ncbi:hypothetical protein [Cellulosilyticum ruminicola]|nr:hypothetical protein [Cellulosilyticum ruminicola]
MPVMLPLIEDINYLLQGLNGVLFSGGQDIATLSRSKYKLS